MKKKNLGTLLVNFGGPRSLEEIEPFLKSLLTDQDVVRTGMPPLVHRFLFHRVARKRAQKLSKDYVSIGGASPIYSDTEAVAEKLRKKLNQEVLTFHRYLTETHSSFIKKLENSNVEEWRVFPMFPQFTYATTGSIARLFHKTFETPLLNKLKWVKSYPSHPAYIKLLREEISKFLEVNQLKEEESIFIFSAHGVPKKFIDRGDLYQSEIETTFESVIRNFPHALSKLSYQSKFGVERWLQPYTIDLCETITKWHEGRGKVIFIPISFTSDHIETLFEIEQQYMPIVKEQGLEPYRVPAFNRSDEWIEAIATILSDFTPVNTSMLIRWEE